MLDFAALSFDEKIAYFMARLSKRELGLENATEMLLALHADLQAREERQQNDYQEYAQLVRAFRQTQPDFYKQVIAEARYRQAEPEDTFSLELNLHQIAQLALRKPGIEEETPVEEQEIQAGDASHLDFSGPEIKANRIVLADPQTENIRLAILIQQGAESRRNDQKEDSAPEEAAESEHTPESHSHQEEEIIEAEENALVQAEIEPQAQVYQALDAAEEHEQLPLHEASPRENEPPQFHATEPSQATEKKPGWLESLLAKTENQTAPEEAPAPPQPSSNNLVVNNPDLLNALMKGSLGDSSGPGVP